MHGEARKEGLTMIKKIFDWIWNIVVASVIAGCILTVVAFSISTSVKLYDIEEQVVELYQISIQSQNDISKSQKQNESMLLYVMGQIDSLKTDVLNKQEKFPKQLEEVKKDSLKRLNVLIANFDTWKKEQINIERKINNRFKKDQPLSYEYLKNVTVRLFREKEIDDTIGWIGTGIIVKITEDFTYILTNKHVAPLGTNVYIIKNGSKYRVDILKNSAFNDLSLIRMNGKFSDKQVIKGFANHKIQEKVYSVGMYLGNYYIYTEGTVAGRGIYRELIINLPAANGCSGSGIFNSKGEIVGLLHAIYKVGFFAVDTSKGICVPTSAIKVFLREFL